LRTLWVAGGPARQDVASEGKEAVMKARVGDRLLPDGDRCRAAVIIGLQNADGSPPYIVKWLSDGHIALVSPGPYTKVVRGRPADEAPMPGKPPA
jgi:hypothetical protein